MRRSPTRLRRIASFAAACLLAMWLALLIFIYTRDETATRMLAPSPERLAAIVSLVERTPAAETDALFTALSTPNFRLMRTRGFETEGESLSPDLAPRYSALLGGRRVTEAVRLVPDGVFRFNLRLRRQLVLQVAMSPGETLRIESTSPFAITSSGLPVGMIAGAAGTLISLLALWTLWREVRPLAHLANAAGQIDLSGRSIAMPDTR